MSSSRLGDSGSITPYPPGIVLGRSATGPPENSDHARQTSRSRKGGRPRTTRNSRPEEERFNVGPVTPRTSATRNSTRRGTRHGRQDRSVPTDVNDVVPNYPPPSFQEAMSTQALSISPSTLTLLSTASPAGTFIHSTCASIPPQPPTASLWPPTDPINADLDSNSDSDDSLQIIENESLPPDHGLPTGSDLDTRVRRDWLHRRKVEFPSPSSHPSDQVGGKPASLDTRGRSQQRPTLDLAAILDAPDNPRSPTISSPKRRFLSLSPLRTIFPSRTPNAGDRPQTAHPTPGTSPYLQSPKGSTFFRSTTSLATSSFLRLPLTSLSNNGKPEKRKLFSSKGKDKPKDVQSPEALDAWEELCADEAEVQQTPTSLLSVVESACSCASPTVGASPTRSLSFTYGGTAETYRSLQASVTPVPQLPPPPENPAHSIHPLSLRDRKVPFVKRPVRRSPAPTPPRIQVPIPVPLEPVLTTVRTRMPQAPVPAPSDPPQPLVHRNTVTAHVTRPSPLSLDPLTPLLSEKAALDMSFWHAVRTPLPITPVKAAHISGNHSPLDPSAPATPSDSDTLMPKSAFSPPPQLTIPAISVRSPIPARSEGLEFGVSKHAWPSPPLIEQPPIFSRAPSPLVDEPITPTRHHYPGRPLPRPPASGQPRAHVDSTFAPNEEFSETVIPSRLSTCPELLIDFDDGTSVKEGADSSAFTTDLVDLSPDNEVEVDTSIYAPAPLFSSALGDLTFMPPSSSTPRPPPSIAEPARNPDTPRFVEITDLDMFALRLAEDEQRSRDGLNYDALLTLAEFIGPANPSTRPSPPRGYLGRDRGTSTSAPSATLAAPTMATGATSSSAITTAAVASSRAAPAVRRSTGAYPPASSSTRTTTTNANGNISLLACIEQVRRRTRKDGRVKVKLTLCDMSVDRCGICLSQFKGGEMAGLTSLCRHAFHDRCLQSWLVRSRTCPLCRVGLDEDGK